MAVSGCDLLSSKTRHTIGYLRNRYENCTNLTRPKRDMGVCHFRSTLRGLGRQANDSQQRAGPPAISRNGNRGSRRSGSRAHVEKHANSQSGQPRGRPPVSRRFLTRGWPFRSGCALLSTVRVGLFLGVLTRADVIAHGECALCTAFITAIEHQAISEND